MMVRKVLEEFEGLKAWYNGIGLELSHLKNVTPTQPVPGFDLGHPTATFQEKEHHIDYALDCQHHVVTMLTS
ncbi:hypothetical protein DSO57_1004797 [Entomophthora muscae]|uniref:Uncharacterized protein n=1 Tax=Entomophthora muscae TaxID=34485 RepID=A0ACC2USZ4_9FUNG|nr:hypothetical protein DSO57_1004797 [Entomophthora muscae]